MPFSKEKNNFTRFGLKHIIVLHLQIFNTQTCIHFKISNFGFTLQPPHSYKIYFYVKKISVPTDLELDNEEDKSRNSRFPSLN